MKWKHHKKRWIDCDRCSLCEQRNKVVLLKGKIPCDILMVGEAPGISEDTLGKPFIGPAGKLLEEIIEAAKESSGVNVSIAFTNVVGCIPKDGTGAKTKEPPKDAIKECSARLKEVAKLCRPQFVVCVGKLSGKWSRHTLKDLGYTFEDIIHPAAILRSKVNKELAIQQTEITLRDLFESVVPF